MEAYIVHLVILSLITVMMVLSYNLTVGYTGLVNFGHVGLLGVGGYASAILTKYHDWPFWLAALAAACLTMVVAGILAIPSKKIKDDYYALVTLGFMFVAQAIFINWDSLTRGTLGIPGIPRPEMFATNNDFMFLTIIVSIFVFLFLYRLVNSPFGRALEAVRDDEGVAEALGKPVFKLKFVAMLISGFIAGLSGVFLAHFIQFISPNSFWLDLLVTITAALMIGGLASVRGTILGVIVIHLIIEPLRFFEIPSELIGPLRLMIYMAILILIIIYRPKGIMGRAQLEN